MDKALEQARQFHEAFGVPNKLCPGIPAEDRCKLRVNLLQEELDELVDAIALGSLTAVLDALTDLQVVLNGSYLEFGLGSVKQAALDEVHASNMTKLDEFGHALVRADGKILKGPNYRAPNLAPLLELEASPHAR